MTEQLGPYRIEGRLGEGGMGVVYRATQVPLNRAVALKVIAPRYSADPAFRERFRREWQLAASLDHPNVVPVYDLGEVDGVAYSAMRLVNGPDLRRLIEEQGALAPERAVAIVEQVASALDAAHQRGLVHRDVKPANILLEDHAGAERAYLSDFGVVKRLGTDPDLTGDQGWIGSVDYVTPEQVRGGAVTPATDVYALGTVLLTMLTGRVPFARDDIAATLYAVVNEPPPLGGVHPGLAPVIAAAMDKDPARRPATAGEVAAAARAALAPRAAPSPSGAALASSAPTVFTIPAPPPADAPPTARAPGRRWATRRNGIAAAAIAAIAGLVAGTTLAFGSSSHHGRPAAGTATTTPATPTSSAPGTSGPPTTTGGPGTSGPPTGPPTTTGGPGPGGSGGAAPVGTGPVTANFDANLGGVGTLTFAVTGAVRQGPFARVNLTLKCHSAGGCSAAPVEWPSGLPPFEAVELLDPVNKELYLPVEDRDGNRLVSDLPDLYFDQGRTYRAWVTFAAPPTSAHDVEVLFPEAGAQVLDVPLSPTSGSWSPAVPAFKFDQPATSTDTSRLNLEKYPVSEKAQTGIEGETAHANRTTVTLSADVLFAFNSATLSRSADQALTSVAQQIAKSGQGTVTVTGYTDDVGTTAYNQGLSQQRARAVVSALQPRTAHTSVTYAAAGDGEANPVAPNKFPDGRDDPEGRQQNRRVTISYTVATSPPPAGQAPATPASTETVTAAKSGNNFTIPYPSFSADSQQGKETYRITVNRRTIGAFTEISGNVTCVGSTRNTPCDTAFDFSTGQLDIDQANGINLVNYRTGTTYPPATSSGNHDPNGAGFGFALNRGGTLSYYDWYLTGAPGPVAAEIPNGGPTIRL